MGFNFTLSLSAAGGSARGGKGRGLALSFVEGLG